MKTRLPVSLGEIASSLRNILSALHVCHSMQWNSESSNFLAKRVLIISKKGFNYLIILIPGLFEHWAGEVNKSVKLLQDCSVNDNP